MKAIFQTTASELVIRVHPLSQNKDTLHMVGYVRKEIYLSNNVKRDKMTPLNGKEKSSEEMANEVTERIFLKERTSNSVLPNSNH